MHAPTSTLAARARTAIRRCQAGDLRGIGALLSELARDVSPVARAWAVPLRAHVWLAFPSSCKEPSIAEVRALARQGEEAYESAWLACRALELAAACFWDGASLDALASIHASTLSPEGASDSVGLRIVRTWQSLFRGDTAIALADDAFTEADALKGPSSVVHAAALRAFARAEIGDSEHATELARRASLMARTEGLPQEEYLAHLVLARVRRFGRQTHRALRIVEALKGVVTPLWRAWLSWEHAYASGQAPTPPSGDAPAPRATRLLCELIFAARDGDRERFDTAAASLRASLATCAFASTDGALLLAATSHEDRLDAQTRPLDAWARGRDPFLPPALHGFRLRSDGEPDAGAAAALVIVGAGAPRRVLWLGEALLEATGRERLASAQRADGRVESLLATLALAGDDGLREEECFELVYGFGYVAARHRASFDVLLHRARTHAASFAAIERVHGRLTLSPKTTFLLRDPRCSERVVDRILRVLARRGVASARTAAEELGISLRAAQVALQELSSGGACAAQREGRALTYVVEDTTFSEPTRKLHAEQLSEPLE